MTRRDVYGGFIVAIAALAVAGCATRKPLVVKQPGKIIEVPVKVYVPIPDNLTAPCPIAEGKVADVLEVARKRRASLEACNAQLKAIRSVQGSAKP